MEIRKLYTVIEEIHSNVGKSVEKPITKVATIAIVKNPLASNPSADVTPLIEYGTELGHLLAKRVLTVLPKETIQSFGKSAVIGTSGEIEHAAALIHPTFGVCVREIIGGGASPIPSTKKVAGSGVTVDVPLHHKEAMTVSSHYDSMVVYLPDAPMPDEVAVILVCTNGGRPNPRIPGLRLEDAKGDGWR